jgi:hypothetical protein
MVLGDNLKKLLENNNNRLCKELLKINDCVASFVSDVDYADVAIENPGKISFVTKDRYDRIIKLGAKIATINRKKPIKLYKKDYLYAIRNWSGGGLVTENSFKIDYIVPDASQGIGHIYIHTPNGRWVVSKDQVAWFKQKVKYIPDPNAIWDKDLRAKFAYMTSPAKFIRKFNIECTDKELEDFNRLFLKDDFCLRIEGLHFELVSGKTIKTLYHYRNHKNDNGSLGNSCMRYEAAQPYVELYSKYPDKIKMLVLKDDNGYVRGRAIVWKCSVEDSEITFMDRIYTDNSNFETFFKVFAEKQQWWYKAEQSRCNWQTFLTPVDNYHKSVTNYIEIILEDAYGELFPYMDTFVGADRYCGGNNMILKNDGSCAYELQSTEGGPFSEEGTVYSEYEDIRIDESDAIYSEYLSSYIYRNSSVRMYNNDYMPEDHDEVVTINGTYYFQGDCVYSDFYDEWITSKISNVVELYNGDSVYDYDCVFLDYKDAYYLEDDGNIIFSEYEGSYILVEDSAEHPEHGIMLLDSYEELCEQEEKEEVLEC